MVRQEAHQDAVKSVMRGWRAEEVRRRRVESSGGDRTLKGVVSSVFKIQRSEWSLRMGENGQTARWKSTYGWWMRFSWLRADDLTKVLLVGKLKDDFGSRHRPRDEQYCLILGSPFICDNNTVCV